MNCPASQGTAQRGVSLKPARGIGVHDGIGALYLLIGYAGMWHNERCTFGGLSKLPIPQESQQVILSASVEGLPDDHRLANSLTYTYGLNSWGLGHTIHGVAWPS